MKLADAVSAVDERLGDGLEAVLGRHHIRRLRKLGWGHVLQPRDDGSGKFAVDRPVREGNLVQLLIDGEEALPAMAHAITGARRQVHLALWHATPEFRLTRERGAPTLRELLATAAERVPVRVLLWAGPPLPLFQPTRGQAKAACQALSRDSKVRCVLDARERTLHCHHEKLLIVDDELAFVGGMDFTDLQGDRHDSGEHPAHEPIGWHDVAAALRGPIVADVATHFLQRWNDLTGDQLPEPVPPPPAGPTRVQLVRTVPEATYKFAPHGEFSALDAYLRALRSAQSLIYLENQFLWSPEIVDVLVDKLRTPPQDRFRIVLLLPRRPSSGRDTTRGQLGRLLEADGDRGRLMATTLMAHDGSRSVSVYVHAKVGIVDDSWMTVGSANLNEHSLFNDTEVNIVLDDAELIRNTRLRLWSEHLRLPVAQIDGDPIDVVDRFWRSIAEEQARLEREGQRRTHRLTLLPGVSKRSERLNGPLRGLLVDG